VKLRKAWREFVSAARPTRAEQDRAEDAAARARSSRMILRAIRKTGAWFPDDYD
jgi:hypothetical protein